MTQVSLETLCDELWEGLGGEVLSVTSKSEHCLRILFQCDDWAGSRKIRRFSIICNQVADSTLSPGQTDELQFKMEHELLWRYNLPHFDLFYNSVPVNAYECLGILWEVHDRIFEFPNSISGYVNPQNFVKYSCEGLGLLARGPEPLMKKYQEAIRENVDTYMIPSYVPKGGYKVLVFDFGYIIAQSFQIEEPLEA